MAFKTNVLKAFFMKKLFLLIYVLFSSHSINAQNALPVDTSLHPETELDSIVDIHTLFLFNNLQKARDTCRIAKKPLMVYFTADWCLPCKQMKEYTFEEDFLGDYLNQNYITCILDATDLEILGLAESMNVHSYPCIIFYNKYGIEKKRLIGFQGPTKLLEIAKNITN